MAVNGLDNTSDANIVIHGTLSCDDVVSICSTRWGYDSDSILNNISKPINTQSATFSSDNHTCIRYTIYTIAH